MALNANLNQAKRNPKDEFYTQLGDIADELRHYKDHFRGKVVYCNCDDPRMSNFFKYFSLKFADLGLKKLITTCYKSQSRDLFSQHDTERAIMLEYNGFRDGDVLPRVEDIGIKGLDGDGDFRSPECIELLKQADIVVTNPPFSLFRKYVAQLMEYDKKFIIIGPKNAITYKDFFPLIKDGRLWIGMRQMSGSIFFEATQQTVDDILAKHPKPGGYWKENDGKIKIAQPCAWFTNLDHKKRHEELILYRRYTPDDYPHYDNYDAIEVGQTKNIPENWEGAMGVPITFLDKHNPDQFEILGITDRDNNSGLKTKEYTVEDVPNPGDLNRRGAIRIGTEIKSTYARILIKARKATDEH